MNTKYLNEFIEEKCGGNVSSFEKEVGFSNASVRPLLVRKVKSINLDRVVQIKERFPDFDIEIFAGIKSGDIKLAEPMKGVPYVSRRKESDYIRNFSNTKYIETLQTFTIPGITNYGDCRMFQMKGSSMFPTIDDDDYVICEKVQDPKNIKDNYVYVVVTFNDGVLIKRVRDRIEKKRSLVLVSDNYAGGNTPKLVPAVEVQELWEVKRRITANLTQNNNMTIRIDDLEIKVAEIQNMLDNYFKGELY